MRIRDDPVFEKVKKNRRIQNIQKTYELYENNKVEVFYDD